MEYIYCATEQSSVWSRRTKAVRPTTVDTYSIANCLDIVLGPSFGSCGVNRATCSMKQLDHISLINSKLEGPNTCVLLTTVIHAAAVQPGLNNRDAWPCGIFSVTLPTSPRTKITLLVTANQNYLVTANHKGSYTAMMAKRFAIDHLLFHRRPGNIKAEEVTTRPSVVCQLSVTTY